MSAVPLNPEGQPPIDRDGWLYDADTGELLGPALKEDWVPRSVKDVEFLLEKALDAETQASALKARKAVLIENMDLMIKRELAKSESIKRRFTTSIAAVVGPLMGKLKSWTCPFGKVRLSSSKATIEIVDEPSAVKYLEDLGQTDAIKKGVLKSKITPDVLGELIKYPEVAKDYGMVVREATTEYKIDVSPKASEGEERE